MTAKYRSDNAFVCFSLLPLPFAFFFFSLSFTAVAAVAAAAGGVDPTYFSTTFQTPDTSYATFNFYRSPYTHTRYTYF